MRKCLAVLCLAAVLAFTSGGALAAPQPTAGDVSMLFAGDIMFHRAYLNTCWDSKKGKYDFTATFEKVTSIISAADIAVANLESPIWNIKKSVIEKYRFAAPAECVPAYAKAGFDVLTTANNHALDQGKAALANTIKVIRENGLKTTGTWRNAAERAQICIISHDGVKVALLAYAKSVRMSGGGVNRINVTSMAADVKRARAAGADAVVLSLHFGTEYTHNPDGYQRSIVNAMRKAGADAVVGAHPHVLQPIVLDRNGKYLAAYSLGNVVSNAPSQDRQFAAFLRFTIHKDFASGKVSIRSVSYVPTWCRMLKSPGGKTQLRVVALDQALKACRAGSDPLIPARYLGELTRGAAMVRKYMGASLWQNK